MISFDTNILLAALEAGAPGHQAMRDFVNSYRDNSRVVICELVLLELFSLLCNPKICKRPLSVQQAVETVQSFRRHPHWRVVDYAPELANNLWAQAAHLPVRLRIYDLRLALTLRHRGVTEFATRNVKDFEGFGFQRTWDPLAE